MNEINKLIGREFIIGFFAPALVFVAASAGILRMFGMLPAWLQIDSDDPLKDSTFIALITTATSLIFMATNRMVFRTLEGYWILDVGHHLNHLQRWRFRRLHRTIAELTKERDLCLEQKQEFTRRRERNRLMRIAAQRYPSKEELLLVTSFGNTVRAFEDYPRVVYGFESINGWSRLNAVMPKAYTDMLSNVRATTDFWVNLWFVSVLVIGEYLLLVGPFPSGWIHRWIPLCGVLTALVSSLRARDAVEQWGEWVKAAFDVFLPVLREKMEFERPASFEAERQLWQRLSQVIVYRHAASLDQLNALRRRASPTEPMNDPAGGAEAEPF